MNKMTTWSRKGQTLVEFALILPLLILIVMMLADLGRGIYYYSVIYNAAREGARTGIATKDSSIIQAAALRLTTGLDPNLITVASSFTCSGTACSTSNTTCYLGYVQVIVTYQLNLITPLVGNFIGANPLILTSRSKMNTEGINLCN